MHIRLPDAACVYGENQTLLYTSDQARQNNGISLSMLIEDQCLAARLSGDETPICYVVLKWLFRAEERRENVRILGDAWERGYGNLEWRGIMPERGMPWYFLVTNGSDAMADTSGRFTEGFGVKVRPSSFCMWQYDTSGITLWMDVRCGTKGVILAGRTLPLADILFAEWHALSAFRCGKQFCREMCPDPIFPKAPVYGFNNWYYAYGNSSEEEILQDARRLADCTVGLENRPYMVIDDGWQPNLTDGPWDSGNDRFPDMKALAAQIREMGILPGIWIRPLRQKAAYGLPVHWRLERNADFLDPSEPDVLAYVKACIERIVYWGYRLIKFDFVTFDIFGRWGMDPLNFLPTGDWSLHDRSKTTAEITVQLYKTIREAAGDAVLIGCNAIGHLCAGLVELNRTGDDTSGQEWQRTRKMGVNTLAFRAMQNGTFYMADADCVGITPHIPWELNKEWLRFLAVSGSPMFISWDRKVDSKAIRSAIAEALRQNSVQQDELIPLDWMENTCPRIWRLNGERVTVDWFGNLIDRTF